MPAQDTAMELSDVQKAMNQLSQNYRNILTLTCVEGRRYKEVSEILDIPLGTVRSRLSRARAQLQHNMNKPSARPTNINLPITPAYIASHILR